MSATLPVRVKALRERLTVLDDMAANVEETGLLADLRADLAPRVVQLSRAMDQRALLLEAGIGLDDPTSLETSRKRSASLLEKFVAEKKAATLKKGAGWANLLRDIKEAAADVARSVENSWRAYRQSVFTGDAPSVVKQRLAMTTENTAVYSRYARMHQAFRAEFESIPVDRTVIERVRAMASELSDIANQFDFDVDKEVKLFLEAIQNGGAPLPLLNDTVLDWLKANNAFESYRVIPTEQ